MLKANLAKLQADEKFGKIHFWGKIFGGANDYYIAYGLRDADVDFPSKHFYCATGDNFAFADLPSLSADDAAAVSDFAVDAAFTGDLDYQLFPAGDGEEEGRRQTLTELHRLSHTVSSIDADTAVALPNPESCCRSVPFHNVK
jgi:hypothetical protein